MSLPPGSTPRPHSAASRPHQEPSISADTLHDMPAIRPGETLAGGKPTPSNYDTLSDTLAPNAPIPAGPRLPRMPEIGLDERVYARMARNADEAGDRHAREASKVGLYITLALNPKRTWHDKLRHFTHALNKHCHVEKLADHRLWKFYHALAMLVKQHCGAEALRLASREDDLYAARLSIGIARADIEREAARFFDELIGNGKICPEYMLPDDFTMVRMIRDQWV